MLRFGLVHTDLDLAASELRVALDLNFRKHDSSFRGGDYYRCDLRQGVVYILQNFDVLDGEPFDPRWPADRTLLELDNLPESLEQPLRTKIYEMEAAGLAMFLPGLPT